MKVLILDDDVEDARRIQQQITLIEGIEADCYHNECKIDYEHFTYDAVILDIEMSGRSGLQIARKLRTHFGDITLLFISRHVHYVFDSFQVHPYAFVRKSHLEDELPIHLHSVLAMVKMNQLAYTDEKHGTIQLKHILYIAKDNNDVVLHMIDGREIRCKTTLKTIEKQMPMILYRINHSVILNFQAVSRIRSDHVFILHNKESVEASRSKWKDAKAAYYEFLKYKYG